MSLKRRREPAPPLAPLVPPEVSRALASLRLDVIPSADSLNSLRTVVHSALDSDVTTCYSYVDITYSQPLKTKLLSLLDGYTECDDTFSLATLKAYAIALTGPWTTLAAVTTNQATRMAAPFHDALAHLTLPICAPETLLDGDMTGLSGPLNATRLKILHRLPPELLLILKGEQRCPDNEIVQVACKSLLIDLLSPILASVLTPFNSHNGKWVTVAEASEILWCSDTGYALLDQMK